jgi:GT2 family glycosyltransferase
MKEPKVAIIISTYNQTVLLNVCLKSLKTKTDYKKYRVYLMDDSGKGKIGGVIREDFPWVRVIINKKNLGFPKSSNKGLNISLKDYNPDYILLLNDDIEIIQRNWLKKMVELGEHDNKTGIIGCQLIYPDGSLQDVGGYLKKWELTKILKFRKNSILDVDHFMGPCMLIKREVVDKIGGYDEIFTPYLLEDTDYCLRAKEIGYSIKVITSIRTIHNKGKTINSIETKNRLLVRFKNDIIFSRRHLRGWNRFFRLFIFLPLVAIFRKKRDQEKLTKLGNFIFRKDAISNIFLLLKVYFLGPEKINKTLEK